jgi:adenylate kinase family enzyme
MTTLTEKLAALPSDLVREVDDVVDFALEKNIKTMRFVIIGTSGSGKSTFANALAKAIHCSFIELDQLYWGPNWTGASHEVFENAVRAATDGDSWVVAGDYSSVRDVLWLRATHIVWLNFSRWVVFSRVVMRTIRRILLRTELWNGNRESVLSAFFSKDSVILYSFSTFTRNRRRYEGMRQDPKYAHLQWTELTKPLQTKEFIEQFAHAENSSSEQH